MGWIVIIAMMVASFAGIVYSFRFLVSSLILLIIIAIMTPRSRKIKRGFAALEKIESWEKNGGPRPPESTFKRAADWYMHQYALDYRQEDMATWRGVGIPADVKQHILSSKVLPYRNGRIL